MMPTHSRMYKKKIKMSYFLKALSAIKIKKLTLIIKWEVIII